MPHPERIRGGGICISAPAPYRPHFRPNRHSPTLIPILFNPRFRSLTRGNLIVFASLAIATSMSGFPHIHANPLLALPALLCLIGLADTVRCMRKRWSWYHGGVLLCLYADLMAICLILFFLLYPYMLTIGETQRR